MIINWYLHPLLILLIADIVGFIGYRYWQRKCRRDPPSIINTEPTDEGEATVLYTRSGSFGKASSVDIRIDGSNRNSVAFKKGAAVQGTGRVMKRKKASVKLSTFKKVLMADSKQKQCIDVAQEVPADSANELEPQGNQAAKESKKNRTTNRAIEKRKKVDRRMQGKIKNFRERIPGSEEFNFLTSTTLPKSHLRHRNSEEQVATEQTENDFVLNDYHKSLVNPRNNQCFIEQSPIFNKKKVAQGPKLIQNSTLYPHLMTSCRERVLLEPGEPLGRNQNEEDLNFPASNLRKQNKYPSIPKNRMRLAQPRIQSSMKAKSALGSKNAKGLKNNLQKCLQNSTVLKSYLADMAPQKLKPLPSELKQPQLNETIRKLRSFEKNQVQETQQPVPPQSEKCISYPIRLKIQKPLLRNLRSTPTSRITKKVVSKVRADVLKAFENFNGFDPTVQHPTSLLVTPKEKTTLSEPLKINFATKVVLKERDDILDAAISSWMDYQNLQNSFREHADSEWSQVSPLKKIPFIWSSLTGSQMSTDPFENYFESFKKIRNGKESDGDKNSSTSFLLNEAKANWRSYSYKDKLPFIIESLIVNIGIGEIDFSDEKAVKHMMVLLSGKN